MGYSWGHSLPRVLGRVAREPSQPTTAMSLPASAGKAGVIPGVPVGNSADRQPINVDHRTDAEQRRCLLDRVVRSGPDNHGNPCTCERMKPRFEGT